MQPQVISFNCILKNRAGQLISTTYNSEVLNVFEASATGLLSGLARGLQNLIKGEKRNISLEAEDAYGLYDPAKVILFPRNKLPNFIKKGEMVHIVNKAGTQVSYSVVELHGNFVSLDGNHPLAGQDLIFEIEAIAAREATRKEIDASANAIATQLLH